jgi:hypothetical protein
MEVEQRKWVRCGKSLPASSKDDRGKGDGGRGARARLGSDGGGRRGNDGGDVFAVPNCAVGATEECALAR